MPAPLHNEAGGRWPWQGKGTAATAKCVGWRGPACHDLWQRHPAARSARFCTHGSVTPGKARLLLRLTMSITRPPSLPYTSS